MDFDLETWQFGNGTQVSWDWCDGPYSSVICNTAKKANVNTIDFIVINNIMRINDNSFSSYEVINISGQVIMKDMLLDKTINLDYLESGIYVVRLFDEDGNENNVTLNIMK
ncbi:MAG: T9SS type A sorting domain-containing protein [Ignavibacteria bacterium]|nr:T9SS type A sorting domain-containing protein [Ignavibacteria bacterium]